MKTPEEKRNQMQDYYQQHRDRANELYRKNYKYKIYFTDDERQKVVDALLRHITSYWAVKLKRLTDRALLTKAWKLKRKGVYIPVPKQFLKTRKRYRKD
jgi:hypothetical protein